MTSKRDTIDAALALAENLHAGKVEPAGLDGELADTCRELFGQVVGERDPLWSLQVDVTRHAIALGALTADELSEWAAVIRQRAAEPTEAPNQSDVPAEGISFASGPHSPEIEGSKLVREPEGDT
ncbi:flagellar hook-length control protein [Mycobacterium paraffinicum]|uniref:Flagellar hook-length control protein n=1 Tax=Mycobacterium paraffinicum TaxID=53378 RepID=A0ABP8EZT5_9MYCO|nr:flagellar hook-length control protein [Mycobacterium paraffinicum]MCV7311788.1 flagellar hook-length control protein [Mycobacterium paraffinicum]